MPPIAKRFATLPDYPLATIPQRKRELLERGVDVIDLGAGDADLADGAKGVETLRPGPLPIGLLKIARGHVIGGDDSPDGVMRFFQ